MAVGGEVGGLAMVVVVVVVVIVEVEEVDGRDGMRRLGSTKGRGRQAD